jgi:hypothetical protein
MSQFNYMLKILKAIYIGTHFKLQRATGQLSTMGILEILFLYLILVVCYVQIRAYGNISISIYVYELISFTNTS